MDIRSIPVFTRDQVVGWHEEKTQWWIDFKLSFGHPLVSELQHLQQGESKEFSFEEYLIFNGTLMDIQYDAQQMEKGVVFRIGMEKSIGFHIALGPHP